LLPVALLKSRRRRISLFGREEAVEKVPHSRPLQALEGYDGIIGSADPVLNLVA
jgi:hypothetical protein